MSAHRSTSSRRGSSYFLWASMPDDALSAAADRGTLRQPAVLAAQVKRHAGRSRGRRRSVEHFAGQWLQVRALESATPDREKFPDFDHYLRVVDAARDRAVRRQRSSARIAASSTSSTRKFTFLNERLARHYGIDGVTAPSSAASTCRCAGVRGGILTQASVLTVSSYATRTSPVLRGRWILDNILDAPPPSRRRTSRTSTTEGRRHAGVAAPAARAAPRRSRRAPSCHKRMDPLGFGLENFDAIGAWRTDRRQVADRRLGHAAGRPHVHRARGAADDPARRAGCVRPRPHRQADDLRARPRPRALRSAATVKKMAAAVAADDYRFSSLVLEIVNSPPSRCGAPNRRPRPPRTSQRRRHADGRAHPAPLVKTGAPQRTLSQEPGR